jgi:hypothetical protein
MTKKKTQDTNATDNLGLAPDVEVPKLVPAVLPGDLGLPVVVKYLGYEIKNSRQFNREQRLYQFQLPQEFGAAKFSLWAQTQLDLKLRNIPRMAVVVLQYLGKGEGERAQHNWTVQQFRGTSEQLGKLKTHYREGCEIAAQAVAMLEQSMDAKLGQHDDDDDLPF